MNKIQHSLTKTNRNSSIELYRIIAILAVFVAHWNGWFVGGIPSFDSNALSLFRVSQVTICAMTSMCVNMFILISGYFGLKLKVESFVKLYLILLAAYVPCYIVTAFLINDFKIGDFIFQFFVFSRGGYFIQCYALLIFVSPLLNMFVENGGRKYVLRWVIALVIIEFWFDCIMNISELGISHGYSPFHFVTMYLIGRCVFFNKQFLVSIETFKWIASYVVMVVVILILYMCGISWYHEYSNPLVIACAICTFVPFLKKTFYNKHINWIAGSSLMVYVLQVTVPTQTALIRIDNYLLANYSYPIYFALSIVFIMLSFLLFVFYDKIAHYIVDPIMIKIVNRYGCIFK